ncbi:hypothetical protein, partial [Acidiphilium iwatense]
SQTGDRRVKCAINGAAKSAGNHYRRAVLFNPPGQMTTHPNFIADINSSSNMAILSQIRHFREDRRKNLMFVSNFVNEI